MNIAHHATAKMPEADIYETEYIYWPWGCLLEAATKWVMVEAPANASLMDYMCGTGYLLAEITNRRPDLNIEGCDLKSDYITYAATKHNLKTLICENALFYSPTHLFDIIICTAGLHHLRPTDQKPFIRKMANEIKTGGFLILGEEVIRPYCDAVDRKIALLDLGYAVLRCIIQKKPPLTIIEAASDVLANDLLERGEHKESLNKLKSMLESYFIIKSIDYCWSPNADITESSGDVLLICQKK